MNVEGGETSVSVAATGGALQITLRGHVNVGSAAELRTAALQLLATGEDVTVNCRHADHLDASVLQVLVALKEELRAKSNNLLLTEVSPSVQSFIRLAGLADALLEAPTGAAAKPETGTRGSLLGSTSPCEEVV